MDDDAPTEVRALKNALVRCGNDKRRLRDRWAEAARERNQARAMVEEFRKIYAKAIGRDDVTDLEALGHLGNVIWNAQAEARAAQFLQERAEAQQDELAEALQTLEDLTAGCWDEGPPGEGWPSDELQQARNKAREVLAAYAKKGRAVGYDADAAEERHLDETWEDTENESLSEQWRKYAQQLKESNDRLSYALGKAERERDAAVAEQDLLARQRDEAFGERERMRKDSDGWWERGNRAFEQRNKAKRERDALRKALLNLASEYRSLVRKEHGYVHPESSLMTPAIEAEALANQNGED